MGQWSIGLYDCRRAVFGLHSSVWDQFVLTPIGSFSCEQEAAVRTNTGWHHLVATADHANNGIKIYRDGVLQNVAPFFGAYGTVQNVGNLFLGLHYVGFLDDVIIYNKTLNQSDVTGLYNMSACCSDQDTQ